MFGTRSRLNYDLFGFQPSYKQDYEKSKDKNVFKPTDTEQYKTMKDNEKSSSDVSFKYHPLMEHIFMLNIYMFLEQLLKLIKLVRDFSLGNV